MRRTVALMATTKRWGLVATAPSYPEALDVLFAEIEAGDQLLHLMSPMYVTVPESGVGHAFTTRIALDAWNAAEESLRLRGEQQRD